MKKFNTQAMEKSLSHIISKLGVDCLKNSKRFHSAIADFLPGFEYETERKVLCVCICSEVSENIINAASKSQSEKQRILKSCVNYFVQQHKLTEQQANELIKVFTSVLWREINSGSNANNFITKNTATSQATVIRSTTVENTPSSKQTVTISSAAKTTQSPNVTVVATATKNKINRQFIFIASIVLFIFFCMLSRFDLLFEELLFDVDPYAIWLPQKQYCKLGDGHYYISNYKRVVEWYRKAAVQGNADAQCNLGVCYYFGNGVSKDYNIAAQLYRKVSNVEDYSASDYFERGDYAEAAKLYRKTAREQLNVRD